MAAPAKTRPDTSMYLSTDIPIKIAANVNTTQDIRMTPLRPSLLFKHPAIRANRAAAPTVMDTINSCHNEDKPNSFLNNIIAPDITLVSYPNRKPPKAANNVNK